MKIQNRISKSGTTLVLVFILYILMNMTACSAPQVVSRTGNDMPPLDQLRDKIAYLVDDPNLFNAQVGVYIESLESDETVFARNEHKLFISASNMKIFTTATALLKFGPNFRYKTGVYHSQNVSDGILHGDLIIRGSGDPSLASRFSASGDSRAFFYQWADRLKSKGISQIDGDIIGDASYFQAEPLGYGWQWDDEPFWYSAQISALTFNDNCIDVTVLAGAQPGEPPVVRFSPPTSYFTVDNSAVTTTADSIRTLFLTRPRLENKLLVRNQIPLNKPKYSESISVEQPALFFIHVLREVMEESGIKVRGNLRTVHTVGEINYTGTSQLFTHVSPPLSEIITAVCKRSQNLYAEQLLITIAAEYGDNATAAEGVRVVKSTLYGMGVAENEFVMHDGSGLSRMNLISPNTVGQLLRYMARHRDFQYFYDSLPIAGVDGTLRRRMEMTPAQGKVRAKTGYVSFARNLSGYVQSADGETFIFSILVNNYLHPTPAINLLQDRLCILLANFKR